MEEINKKSLDENEYYSQAFSRNIGLFSEKEQRTFRDVKVAIAGLGGVGGNYCLSLTRMGIGNFSIADFDTFEIKNINRQAGADMKSIGKGKCAVMKEKILEINPFAHVQAFEKGIFEENIDAFLEGVAVVIDGLDFFCIKERLLLFRKAREKGIMAITAPPIGFGAALLVFDPKGMSFEKYFGIKEKMTENEMLLQFGLGLSPSLLQRKYFKPTSIDFSNKKTPSLGIGTQMCSAIVSCEVAKILLGKKIKTIPYSTQFDPFVQKYKKIYLFGGNNHPKQLIKKYIIKKILAKQSKI